MARAALPLIVALLSAGAFAQDADERAAAAEAHYEAREAERLSPAELVAGIALYRDHVAEDWPAYIVESNAEWLVERPELLADAPPEWFDELAEAHRALLRAGRDERAYFMLRDLAGYFRLRGMTKRAEEVVYDGYAHFGLDSERSPYVVEQLVMLHSARHEWQVALDLIHAMLPRLEDVDAEVRYNLIAMRAEVRILTGLPDLAVDDVDFALANLARLRDAGEKCLGGLITAMNQRVNLRFAAQQHELVIEEIDRFLERNDRLSPAEEDPRSYRLATFLRSKAIAAIQLSEADAEYAERARSYLDEARSVAEEHGYATELFSIAAWRAYAELRHGRLGASREAVASARRILDGLEEASVAQRAVVAAVASAVDRAAGADADDLRAHERALEAILDEEIEIWRSTPREEGGVGFLQYGDMRMPASELFTLVAERDDGGPAAAFDVLLRLQTAAGSLHPRLGEVPVDLAAVRAGLVGPGTGLLVYFEGQDRLHVFAVDGEEVAYAASTGWFAASRRIKSYVRRLRALPGSERIDALRSSGRELVDTLLPPAVARRVDGWKAFSVVGGEVLRGLPFEALPGPSGGWIGAEKAIAHLPSVPAGLALRARGARRGEATRSSGVCLVAGAVLHPEVRARFPDLAELPVDRARALALVDAFPRGRVDLLFGPEANAVALAGGRLGPARVLFFLAHGVTDRARLRTPGMALSPAPGTPEEIGLFWCSDAEALDAPPLTVLAVCGSGGGKTRAGDAEAANLAGAFLLAGSDAVVLPDADVLLRPTEELLGVFQEELARGLSPAEALRAARAALIEGGDYADPYYHAQIRAVGLAHDPLFPNGAQPAAKAFPWWIAGVAAGVAALFALILRRR